MRFIKYIIYHVQVHKNIPFYMYTYTEIFHLTRTDTMYIEILHISCTDILYSIYRVQIYRNIPYIMYRYAEIECIEKFLFIWEVNVKMDKKSSVLQQSNVQVGHTCTVNKG